MAEADKGTASRPMAERLLASAMQMALDSDSIDGVVIDLSLIHIYKEVCKPTCRDCKPNKSNAKTRCTNQSNRQADRKVDVYKRQQQNRSVSRI